MGEEDAVNPADTSFGPRLPLWTWPWGYREGALLSAGLLATGFALQAATGGYPAVLLAWPLNLVPLALLLLTLGAGQLFFRSSRLVQWAGSLPAAICAIGAFAAVGLLMGLVPQSIDSAPAPSGSLGLDRITSGWPYLLVVTQFLLVLGFSALRGLWPWRWSRLVFLANHVGLFVAVCAAHLGSGSLERLAMRLVEQQPVWLGQDVSGKTYELDFALKLTDFDVEYYPPQLALAKDNELLLDERGRPVAIADLEPGKPLHLGDWALTVTSFLDSAGRIGDGFAPSNAVGCAPAAEVEAVNVRSGQKKAGWVSCGSFAQDSAELALDSGKALVMLDPRPRRFVSKAILYRKHGPTEPVVLEVNHPLAVTGWRLYQIGYDEQLGRWSNVSYVEAVRDPWLPAVYAGIALMILGALGLVFFRGRR